MTGLVAGLHGVHELGRSLVDWRRPGLTWWAVILLFYPLLSLSAAGLAWTLGAVERPIDVQAVAGRLADPLSLLAMIGFLLIIGPLPEELGWRAYLQDRLQRSWSVFRAALLVGIVWWTWHLPLYLLPGYYEAFDRGPPAPAEFFIGILVAAILYAWIYNVTDRSVLAVVILHFMENFTGELLGMAEAVRPYRLALGIGVVGVVVWGWGRMRSLGRREVPARPGRPEPSTSEPRSER